MENRRKIMMWGCLLMTFWLAACHKGDGGKTGVEPTAEVSSEMLEAGQGSTPETYLIYYEDLVHLQHLESLLIWLNRRDNEFCQEIADEIDSLSFICDMNNLTYICLENIDLPDDLSPLFSHHFEDIILTSCNLTEHSFSYLKDDAFYPSHLELEGNQIKDATIFTAMQNKLVDGDINAVYRLGLSKNPLEKLGDCLTNKWLLQYGENLEGISLRLYGTDFEEYSFEWMTD